MHLWYEHLLDRQKPFAASGRAVAAALLAALLLFTVPGVLAEDGEEPFAVSFAGPAGYPAPDVPKAPLLMTVISAARCSWAIRWRSRLISTAWCRS